MSTNEANNQQTNKQHTSVSFPCVFCGGDPPATKCNITSVEEIRRIVQEKRYCFKFMSSKHQRKDCTSKSAFTTIQNRTALRARQIVQSRRTLTFKLQ